MFESTLHRAAETVRSEAFASLACPCDACHGRASPAPQPILSCAARSPQARPASAFFPKMSPSKPSCPLSRYRPGLQTFLQPAGACGRPMGSDSHPRILRLAPPSPQRIDYPYLSRLLRQNHSSFSTSEIIVPDPNSIPLLGQAFHLIRPFRDFTGNRVLQSSQQWAVDRLSDRSPAGTTPRHAGLFPPFGRASISRRQMLRFGLHPSGTTPHFSPSDVPANARARATGHWRRVSPALFPNADVPTVPTAESRRLSERFSSRLCTELQNGLEGLIFSCAVFKLR